MSANVVQLRVKFFHIANFNTALVTFAFHKTEDVGTKQLPLEGHIHRDFPTGQTASVNLVAMDNNAGWFAEGSAHAIDKHFVFP